MTNRPAQRKIDLSSQNEIAEDSGVEHKRKIDFGLMRLYDGLIGVLRVSSDSGVHAVQESRCKTRIRGWHLIPLPFPPTGIQASSTCSQRDRSECPPDRRSGVGSGNRYQRSSLGEEFRLRGGSVCRFTFCRGLESQL